MVDLFEQELSKLNFPNYQNYNEINEAYNDIVQKRSCPEKKGGQNKTLSNGLMGKLQMKLKIVINYLKSL